MPQYFLSFVAGIAFFLASPINSHERDRQHSQFLPFPNYPREAALECVQGEVLVRFVVSETFEPTEIEILRSVPDQVFDEVVFDALDKWIVNAEPGSQIEELFEFEIENCD